MSVEIMTFHLFLCLVNGIIELLLLKEEVIDLQSSDDDFENSPKRCNIGPSAPPVTRCSESLSTSTCGIDVCPKYITHYCALHIFSLLVEVLMVVLCKDM